MDAYILWLLVLGVGCFGAAWVPHLVYGRPISLPIIYVALGALLFAIPSPLRDPDPLQSLELTERLSELLVIVSLTGVGLKLDRRVGWRSWGSTWRLLGITMPLCIVGFTLLGWGVLGLVPATAVLLAAALAPTDPVLAAEVQAGPPSERNENEVRFALTSEAGLNDGLAFPFTNLAIAAAGAGASNWHFEWLWYDVGYKIIVGVLFGVVLGYMLAYLMFRVGGQTRLAKTGEAIAAPALTLIPYALTQLVDGYGFLAVFVAAIAFRSFERDHEFHRTLHDFSDNLERMLMAFALILLGGAVVGGLLQPLTWPAALVGLAFLLIVRPAAGIIGLIGSKMSLAEKLAISFFGIRGIGSIYYLAYGLNEASIRQKEFLWSIAGWVVVASIVIHGITAAPMMRWIERRESKHQAA